MQAKTGGGYDPVDSWAFDQTYLDGGDIGDSSDQTLVLRSVRRTGHTGTAITLDPVDFTYHTRPNRVEGGTPARRRQHPPAHPPRPEHRRRPARSTAAPSPPAGRTRRP
ncbi:hypothetical protein STENM327S_02333 [Streptomyces tendae]